MEQEAPRSQFAQSTYDGGTSQLVNVENLVHLGEMGAESDVSCRGFCSLRTCAKQGSTSEIPCPILAGLFRAESKVVVALCQRQLSVGELDHVRSYFGLDHHTILLPF
jgi:hypothetical protein